MIVCKNTFLFQGPEGISIRGKSFHRNRRGSFFAQRVVGMWTELPDEAVETCTMTPFKEYLDKEMDTKGLEKMDQTWENGTNSFSTSLV